MPGLFGSNIKPGTKRQRQSAERPLKHTRGLFGPAINELEVSLDTYQTNLPINEKEGNKPQAGLERDYITSIGAALKYLKKAEK